MNNKKSGSKALPMACSGLVHRDGYFVGADDAQSPYSHLSEAAVKLGLAEQKGEVTG